MSSEMLHKSFDAASRSLKRMEKILNFVVSTFSLRISTALA